MGYLHTLFWPSELTVKLCINIYHWVERNLAGSRRERKMHYQRALQDLKCRSTKGLVIKIVI